MWHPIKHKRLNTSRSVLYVLLLHITSKLLLWKCGTLSGVYHIKTHWWCYLKGSFVQSEMSDQAAWWHLGKIWWLKNRISCVYLQFSAFYPYIMLMKQHTHTHTHSRAFSLSGSFWGVNWLGHSDVHGDRRQMIAGCSNSSAYHNPLRVLSVLIPTTIIPTDGVWLWHCQWAFCHRVAVRWSCLVW